MTWPASSSSFQLIIRQVNGDQYAITATHSSNEGDTSAQVPAIHTLASIDKAQLLIAAEPLGLGQVLADAIFSAPPVGTSFAEARDHARRVGSPLRLILDLDPRDDWLQSLPWELVVDPAAPSRYLARSEQILLSRLVESPAAQLRSIPLPDRPRILTAFASPTDLADYRLAPIDSAGLVAAVERALSATELHILARPISAPVTIDALTAALSDGIDIAIIVCHGTFTEDTPYLCLERQNGTAVFVSGAAIERALSGRGRLPALVVLAACDSFGRGPQDAMTLTALGPRLIAAGIPSVIAMQGKMPIDTTLRLIPAFLRELRRDWRIDRALATARAALDEDDDWWRPALLTSAPDSLLWPPPPLDTNTGPRTIPPPAADLIGRHAEVSRLREAMRAAAGWRRRAIIAIRGLGGVGKTELALALAHQVAGDFPDGQIFIGCAGSSAMPHEPEALMRRVVAVLAPAEPIPEQREALTALLQRLFAGRRFLLVADDVRDAAQVLPLLPPVGAGLIVTTRSRFALPGQEALDLEGLTPANAVALLRQICPRLSGAEAQQIANYCGYLPLALRISAGLLASDDTLPPMRYLTRLVDARTRLAALRDPDNQSLDVAASLMLSFDALDTVSQQVLAQLAVFAGSFDAQAVQVIVRGDGASDVLESIGLLRRRCLLAVDHERGRFSLHTLVRAFAEAQLNADARPWLRSITYWEQLLAVAVATYHAGGDGVMTALAQSDRERDNLDGVWAWMLRQPPHDETDDLIVRLALAAPHLDDLRLPRQIWRQRLEVAIAAARRLQRDSEVGTLTNDLGNVLLAMGESTAAESAYQAALESARAADELSQVSRVRTSQGDLAAARGDTAAAIAHYEAALAIDRARGNERSIGILLGNLGVQYRRRGDLPQARALLEERLAIARRLGDRRAEGIALGNLGAVAVTQKDLTTADRHYADQHTIARELGDRRAEHTALRGRALVAQRQGDLQRARLLNEEAAVIARASDDPVGEAGALGNLGSVQRALGQIDAALEHSQQALALYRKAGDQREIQRMLLNIGDLHADNRRNPQAALEPYREALAVAQQLGDRQLEAQARGAVALSYAELDDIPRATSHFEAHRELARSLGLQRDLLATLRNLSVCYERLSDTPAYLQTKTELLALARTLGETRDEADSLFALAMAHGRLGDDGAANSLLEMYVALAQRLGERRREAVGLLNLGVGYLRIKDPVRAEQTFRSSYSVANDIREYWCAAWAARELSGLSERAGRLDEAIRWLEIVAWHEGNDPKADSAQTTAALARLRKQRATG